MHNSLFKTVRYIGFFYQTTPHILLLNIVVRRYSCSKNCCRPNGNPMEQQWRPRRDGSRDLTGSCQGTGPYLIPTSNQQAATIRITEPSTCLFISFRPPYQFWTSTSTAFSSGNGRGCSQYRLIGKLLDTTASMFNAKWFTLESQLGRCVDVAWTFNIARLLSPLGAHSGWTFPP